MKICTDRAYFHFFDPDYYLQARKKILSLSYILLEIKRCILFNDCMKYSFYKKRQTDLSTYFKERGEIIKDSMILTFKYKKVERDILESNDYSELVEIYEIKTLDDKTKLRELKIDKIRVIHFIYDGDVFVYLGTFIKKTKKTPQIEIEKNNNRLREYIKRKEGEKNE